MRELTSNCLLEGTLKQDLVELVESQGRENVKKEEAERRKVNGVLGQSLSLSTIPSLPSDLINNVQ